MSQPQKSNASDNFLTSYTEWLEWVHSESHDAGAPADRDTEVSVRGALEALPVDTTSPRIVRLSTCPYCNGQISTMDEFENEDHSKPHQPKTQHGGFVRACGHCGWWFVLTRCDSVIECIPPVGGFITRIYESIYKRFKIHDKNVPLTALRQHLEHKRSDIYNVDTGVFEHLIASVYADFFPHSDIRHIGGPGDNGIDLYAVINDEPHIVQIKRRASPKRPEGPKVVRELIGAMFVAGVDHAHLVTTAERFTKAAYDHIESENLERYKCRIQLKALPEIQQMLQIANKKLRFTWKEVWQSLSEKCEHHGSLIDPTKAIHNHSQQKP